MNLSRFRIISILRILHIKNVLSFFPPKNSVYYRTKLNKYYRQAKAFRCVNIIQRGLHYICVNA